jgi:hypothetical protein
LGLPGERYRLRIYNTDEAVVFRGIETKFKPDQSTLSTRPHSCVIRNATPLAIILKLDTGLFSAANIAALNL